MSTQHALYDRILPDILLVEDLAYHLRRSPASIRRLLREGHIPGRRIGNRWVVDRRAFLATLQPKPRLLP